MNFRGSKFGAVVLLAALVLIGCGVKDRPTVKATPPAPLSGGNLPTEVLATKDKKFFVRPSTRDVQVGEISILYKLATQELDLPSAPDYSFQVRYWMPTMPEMPVTPAKVEMLAPGQVRVTYDISMGGLWEFTLEVLKSGVAVDSLTYSYDVPE